MEVYGWGGGVIMCSLSREFTQDNYYFFKNQYIEPHPSLLINSPQSIIHVPRILHRSRHKVQLRTGKEESGEKI